MPIFHRDSTASSSGSSRYSSGSSRSSRSSMSSRSGSSSAGSSHRRSLFHRNPEDPSIQSAREQIVRAEAAERQADQALIASRRAVKDAKEHARHLEREAAEESRLAKIKQDQAKSISKRAKPLGRHV